MTQIHPEKEPAGREDYFQEKKSVWFEHYVQVGL